MQELKVAGQQVFVPDVPQAPGDTKEIPGPSNLPDFTVGSNAGYAALLPLDESPRQAMSEDVGTAVRGGPEPPVETYTAPADPVYPAGFNSAAYLNQDVRERSLKPGGIPVHAGVGGDVAILGDTETADMVYDDPDALGETPDMVYDDPDALGETPAEAWQRRARRERLRREAAARHKAAARRRGALLPGGVIKVPDQRRAGDRRGAALRAAALIQRWKGPRAARGRAPLQYPKRYPLRGEALLRAYQLLRPAEIEILRLMTEHDQGSGGINQILDLRREGKLGPFIQAWNDTWGVPSWAQPSFDNIWRRGHGQPGIRQAPRGYKMIGGLQPPTLCSSGLPLKVCTNRNFGGDAFQRRSGDPRAPDTSRSSGAATRASSGALGRARARMCANLKRLGRRLPAECAGWESGAPPPVRARPTSRRGQRPELRLFGGARTQGSRGPMNIGFKGLSAPTAQADLREQEYAAPPTMTASGGRSSGSGGWKRPPYGPLWPVRNLGGATQAQKTWMTGLRPVKGFSAQTRHTAKKNLTSAWNHVWWTWPSGAFDSPGDPRLVPFVKSFQKKYRLPQTGYLDLATLNRMRAVRRAGVSDSDLIQKAIYFISGSRNQLLNQLRLYDPRVYSRYPTTQPGSWRNGRRTPQGLQRAREGMTGWGLTALFLSTQDRNSDVKMPTAVELRIIKNMARTSQRTATRDHLNIAAASRSPGTPQRAAPSAGRARQGVLLRLATKLRQKASVQADALRRIQERAPGPAQGALGRAEEAARRAAAAAEAAAAAAAAGGSGMTAAEVRALMDQLLAQFRAEMAAASAAAAGMPPQYQDAVAAQSGGSLREGEEIPTAVANLSAAAGDTSVAASIAAGTAAIEAAEATAAAAREEAASWVEGGVDAGEALEASEEWTDEMVAQAEAAAAAAAAQADGGFKLTPIKLAIGGALVWWLFLRKK